MAREIAISIAVAHVPGFPMLEGAHFGGSAFARWGERQGLEVLEFSDATAPIRFDDVYDRVRELVKAGDVVRLFLFFAGHGLSSGGGDDVWLLSGVRDNLAEAIDVQLSVWWARKSGIRHVAFIADACRTAPNTQLLGIRGRPIFPPYSVPRTVVEVDQFYATSAGDAAWERQPDDPSTPPYGIYTRCLMPALDGERPEAVTRVVGGRTRNAVLAKTLRDYLERAVPATAYREVGRNQQPDSQPGSYWEPNVLAWVPAEISPEPAPAEPSLTGSELIDRSPFLKSEFASNLEARGRAAFETGAGLSLHGTALQATLLGEGYMGLLQEAGATHVAGSFDSPTAALLQVEGSSEPARPFGRGDATRWAATAMFPGYVGIIRVGTRGVDHVAYVPIDGLSFAKTLSGTK